ncbi:hypothetical protein SDC9_183631 [bioreactor metagenome]|uniref:Uncharacterized protein n=1 Tax=bioreactor metagenome TaxID=1076179 RepID=A0A645HAS1_9ZZZZ
MSNTDSTIFKKVYFLRFSPLPSCSGYNEYFSTGITLIFLHRPGKKHFFSIRRKSTGTYIGVCCYCIRKNRFRLTPLTCSIFFYNKNIAVLQVCNSVCNDSFLRLGTC